MQACDEIGGAELIGRTEAVRALRKRIAAVAPLRSTVLLCGETGSGKGLVAKLLHRNSPRASSNLVHVDCAALPLHLAESELFGHERGSFTGAVERRVGRFELAGHGTVFLDEVGELEPTQQVRLLRVLQDREFERIGGNRTLPMAARVIAATSRNLSQAVADGEFRADLYFRLNVVRIEVPPLRDRRGDIPLLVAAAMARLAGDLGLAPCELPEPAMECLRAYDWPGNVRELSNVVERLLVHCAGNRIAPEEVEATLADGRIPNGRRGVESAPTARLDRFGRVEESVERIGTALHESGGNIARAARHLGVPRSTLRHWIRRHGIARGSGERAGH